MPWSLDPGVEAGGGSGDGRVCGEDVKLRGDQQFIFEWLLARLVT
jgi:hypothetical protein